MSILDVPLTIEPRVRNLPVVLLIALTIPLWLVVYLTAELWGLGKSLLTEAPDDTLKP